MQIQEVVVLDSYYACTFNVNSDVDGSSGSILDPSLFIFIVYPLDELSALFVGCPVRTGFTCFTRFACTCRSCRTNGASGALCRYVGYTVFAVFPYPFAGIVLDDFPSNGRSTGNTLFTFGTIVNVLMGVIAEVDADTAGAVGKGLYLSDDEALGNLVVDCLDGCVDFVDALGQIVDVIIVVLTSGECSRHRHCNQCDERNFKKSFSHNKIKDLINNILLSISLHKI